MNYKLLDDCLKSINLMNKKYGWKSQDYKLINVKHTDDGFKFICRFHVDEILLVVVNPTIFGCFRCDCYDITDTYNKVFKVGTYE